VQLGKSQLVGIFNDQGVGIGNINAGFDDGGADHDLNITIGHLLHHITELFLVHFAVGNTEGDLRKLLLEPGGFLIDGVYPVVQVINLTAPGNFTANGIGQNIVVMLNDIGLYRIAVRWGLLDGGEVPEAAEGHVQGAGNGCRRERQGIDTLRKLL